MPHTYTLRTPVPAEPGQRAFWIQSEGFSESDYLPSLQEDLRAKVVILGGGMTGLWTAWRMLELDPQAEIVILEADFCGSGASGRNGGQVHTWFDRVSYLNALVGRKEGLRLARATRDAMDEMEQLEADGTLKIDLGRNGFVSAAIAKAHEGGWDDAVAALAADGEHPYEVMDAEMAQKVTGGAAGARGGVFEAGSGSMQPFKLCYSLRQRLVERGVKIYERTPVTSLTTGPVVELVTPGGTVRADKVLLATNAWAGSIPQINRVMHAVDGNVIATEPIPELLDEIGLEAGRAHSDSQVQVLYFQRTLDDRMVIGQGSGLPIYRDHIGARTNYNPRLEADVTAELFRMYPKLSKAKIDYAWIGPIDISVSHLPVIDHLNGAPNVTFCVGWTGTALAQIPVVARMLAAKMLDIDNEWSRSPMMHQRGRIPKIFPEPFRQIGAIVVRKAVIRRVRREREGLKVGVLTRALISFMPRYKGSSGTEYQPDTV